MKYAKSIKGVKTYCYSVWYNMMNRCYNEKHTSYHLYGGKGVVVCEEWQDFNTFAAWFYQHYTEGLFLDKDIKGGGVYSPSTCTFVSRLENNRNTSKNVCFKVQDPNGKIWKVEHVRAFAEEHGLTHSSLAKLGRGELQKHKGWTLWG